MKLLHILELPNVGCRLVPYTSSLTEGKDGHTYVNRTLNGRRTHNILLRPRKYDSYVPIFSALGLECFSFERFHYVGLTHNLVPRSLVNEAKGEIWSNPICTPDHLSEM